MTNACTLSSCFVFSEVESKIALDPSETSVEEEEDAVTDNSFIGSGSESN
jgi:hypothetical protein